MEQRLKANVDVALLKRLYRPIPIETTPIPSGKRLQDAVYALDRLSVSFNRHRLDVAKKHSLPIVVDAMRVINMSMDMVDRINRLRNALAHPEVNGLLAEALDRQIALLCQRNVLEITYLTTVYPILWTATSFKPFLPKKHPLTKALPSQTELSEKMERLKTKWQAVLLSSTCE